jgi:NADH:ubiquinone oxidoreductase subunit 3 (subunit A)
LVLTPRRSVDPMLSSLAAGRDLGTATAKFPLNIAPPTDDSPFFFHMLRLRDILNRSVWKQGEKANPSQAQNLRAVFVLGVLLFVVIALTLACIIAPLALTTKKSALRGAGPLFVFFASIGFGFMFVEISQMQRLIVFLGHPTYGLSVVLFALLLSTGLGSQLTQKMSSHRATAAMMWRFGLLLCALVLFGKLTPYAVGVFQGATTPLRILVATGILFPLGVFMGMAFPLGMKVATDNFRPITPWLWGINGATSVCGSVAAVVVALNASISASFWTGVACYVIAVVAFLSATQESAAEARQGALPA